MELLEREEHLALLERCSVDAARGDGSLVFITGEAGVGKTALARQVRDRWIAAGHRVAQGACDPLTIPTPLGPLRDIAPGLGRRVQDLLAVGEAPYRLFDAVLDDLRSAPSPTLLTVEDLHWSDAASLDWLRHLGRRVDTAPALVVVTLRDDQGGRHSPVLTLLADLVTSPSVRRVRLEPLSAATVAGLAAAAGADGEAVYRRTGGNPFLVAQLLAVGDDVIPRTVSDAILGRCARLPPHGRRAVEVLAVAGIELAPPLLDALVASEGARSAVDGGVLRWDGLALGFPHELAREAVLDSIPEAERRGLHGRILRVLLRVAPRERLSATIVHHAVAARDGAAVVAHAPLAAEQARRAGANREAACHLEEALRWTDFLDDGLRADLLERLAEAHLSLGHLAPALDAGTAALRLLAARGDHERSSVRLGRTALVHLWAGDESAAQRASDESLRSLPSEATAETSARVLAARTRFLLGRGDFPAILDISRVALAGLDPAHDPATAAAVLIDVGLAEALLGCGQGKARIEEALRLALAHDVDEHVCRACNNLAQVTLGLERDLAATRRWVAQGLTHCSARSQDRLARALLFTAAELAMLDGDWGSADEVLCDLDQGGLSPRQRSVLLHLRGRLRARRGVAGVWADLDAARALAESRVSGEMPQVTAARAEAWWILGDAPAVLGEVARGLALPGIATAPWVAGELAVMHRRAGGEPELPPARLPDPCSLELRGHHARASAEWLSLGCPYEAATAALGSDDADVVRDAHARLRTLGARAVEAMAARRLRALGVTRIDRGPRPGTRRHPLGLSERQAAVLELVALGLRNQEIADRLFISVKTVERHVSAVLEKVGARSRIEAVRTVLEGRSPPEAPGSS